MHLAIVLCEGTVVVHTRLNLHETKVSVNLKSCVGIYVSAIFTAASGLDYSGGGGGGRPRSDGESGGCTDLSGGSILGKICDDLPELQEDAGEVRHDSDACFQRSAAFFNVAWMILYCDVFFSITAKLGRGFVLGIVGRAA